MRKSATVDWQKRESVRARMRNLVRRLLRRWKYPPDAAEEAIKLVLEQAECWPMDGISNGLDRGMAVYIGIAIFF